MDRKLVLLSGVCSLFLFSCAPVRESESVVLLSPREMTATDSIVIPLTNVQSCCIWDDSLLVAKHKRNSSERALSVYNTKSREVVYNIDYGSGDDCVLGFLSSVSQEGVLLWDYVKGRVLLLTREILERREKAVFQETNLQAQYAVATTDHRILYLNPASFEGEDKRFLLTDTDYHAAAEKKSGYDNYNVVDGYILMEEDRERLCYADKHTGEIEFYRDKNTLVKRLQMAAAPSPEYYIREDGRKKHRIFLNYVPFSFVSATSRGSIIALLYDPYYLTSDEKYVYAEPSASIMMLDWEGNLASVFTLPDHRHPKGCSISPEGKVNVYYCEEQLIRVVTFEANS